MEIQLSSADVKFVVVIDGVRHELKKPKMGQLKVVLADKDSGSLGPIEKMLISMGMSQEVFDNLEVDHLAKITEGLIQMITPKKG